MKDYLVGFVAVVALVSLLGTLAVTFLLQRNFASDARQWEIMAKSQKLTIDWIDAHEKAGHD